MLFSVSQSAFPEVALEVLQVPVVEDGGEGEGGGGPVVEDGGEDEGGGGSAVTWPDGSDEPGAVNVHPVPGELEQKVPQS